MEISEYLEFILFEGVEGAFGIMIMSYRSFIRLEQHTSVTGLQ